MSRLDESRWKKHGERYSTVITHDRGLITTPAVIDARSGTMLFAARVDIDIYDASGKIVHIAGKSEFPMFRRKRQYKHRNGDDCVTSTFSDASKIGTVLIQSIVIFIKLELEILTNLHVLDLPESEKHNFGIMSVCEHDSTKTF
ncbi:hypothetical protein AVEN_85741-1 [Araneus ventricosus]|uniref:Uncharacterized protein n=1 Tax=Araneus ventricosus TaxID=182803 RepID=A0A4Y2JZ91_ARAVE|nr:hypothetical protein AVEN_85741-1 [Araneus ventricosus]